jgi:hypothetical protein
MDRGPVTPMFFGDLELQGAHHPHHTRSRSTTPRPSSRPVVPSGRRHNTTALTVVAAHHPPLSLAPSAKLTRWINYGIFYVALFTLVMAVCYRCWMPVIPFTNENTPLGQALLEHTGELPFLRPTSSHHSFPMDVNSAIARYPGHGHSAATHTSFPDADLPPVQGRATALHKAAQSTLAHNAA